MKSTFILITILLFSKFSSSQDKQQVLKFRAFKAGMFSVDPPDSSGWQETDILVVINFNDAHLNKINVYAKKNNQYDIVEYIKDYTDESKTSWSVYKGVNDDGELLTIELGLFENTNFEHISTIIITNKNRFSIVYKLKKNE